MFCRNCGKEIPDFSEMCPACGTPQTITEIEYHTGAKSPLGAALRRFREEPVPRRVQLVLEGLGILLGIAAVVFACAFPGEAFTVGLRAVLGFLGSAGALGFGIALCRTLMQCGGSEV